MNVAQRRNGSFHSRQPAMSQLMRKRRRRRRRRVRELAGCGTGNGR